MASHDTEREQPSRLREQAAELRQLAERLGRDGYRDQAARHLLEARLHDLRATALSSLGRAA
jgi:hypothetical protein